MVPAETAQTGRPIRPVSGKGGYHEMSPVWRKNIRRNRHAFRWFQCRRIARKGVRCLRTRLAHQNGSRCAQDRYHQARKNVSQITRLCTRCPLNGFELIFFGATQRADPTAGDIFPCRPRRNTVIRISFCRIVDVPAYYASVFCHKIHPPFPCPQYFRISSAHYSGILSAPATAMSALPPTCSDNFNNCIGYCQLMLHSY